MTNVIDLTKITPKTELGYTQGLPLGISVVDSNGGLALTVTGVQPSSDIVATGMMYYVAPTLYVWNATEWKTLTINT